MSTRFNIIGEKRPTEAEVLANVEASMMDTATPGFCTICGEWSEGYEGDANGAPCNACGAFAVIGAEDLLLRGIYTPDSPAESVGEEPCPYCGGGGVRDELAEPVTGPHGVARLLRPWEAESREHTVTVFLDTRGRPIGEPYVLSIGSLNASTVHPRELFREAIVRGAASVILAHNHPSGDTDPSGDDLEITRRLVEAGRIVGINLLDHMILSVRGWRSLRVDWPAGTPTAFKSTPEELAEKLEASTGLKAIGVCEGPKPEPLAPGVLATVTGDTLTLTVDIGGPGVPSKSGASRVLASTRGNVTLPNGVTVGLNVYRKVR